MSVVADPEIGRQLIERYDILKEKSQSIGMHISVTISVSGLEKRRLSIGSEVIRIVDINKGLVGRSGEHVIGGPFPVGSGFDLVAAAEEMFGVIRSIDHCIGPGLRTVIW